MTDAEVAKLAARADRIGMAVARKAKAAHLHDECASAALAGLAEACRTWSEDGGYSFETWATARMRDRACDALRAWLGRCHGRKPQAARYDVTDDFGFDDMVGWAPSVEDIIDFDSLEDDERFAQVSGALAGYPQRTQDAVLYETRGSRLADVADEYGVTQSRLSQVRKKAHADLRQQLAG